MKKYSILYSYFETNSSKNRLNFFIKHGIKNNEDVSYIFLINNKCSLKIPNFPNVKIIKRKNIGYDFGAWKHGLEIINKDEFDNFIFMNDTVTGPFLPRYIPNDISWYSMFCKLLSNQVKLSGLSINYFPWKNKTGKLKHVQSMMFCTDKIGLNILSNNIFNTSYQEFNRIIKKSKRLFILKFEIGMSLAIIKKGYKLAALYICDCNKRKTGDIWKNGRYFKSTINPFETLFIKKNRINSPIINLYINQLNSFLHKK